MTVVSSNHTAPSLKPLICLWQKGKGAQFSTHDPLTVFTFLSNPISHHFSPWHPAIQSYSPACIAHMLQGLCFYCSLSSMTFSYFSAGKTHTFSLNMSPGAFDCHPQSDAPQHPSFQHLGPYNVPGRGATHLGHCNTLGSGRIWLPTNL